MVDSSAVFTVYPRQWISKTFDTSPFKVRIVSYNVLTDLAIPAGSYSYVSETCLYMKNRHSCIMKEIAHFQADIVAFQEVDSHHYYTWLRADMAALGYSGEHSKRLDDFGMATFYKKSRFTLVKRKDCILHALVETHLQKSGLEHSLLQTIRKSIEFPHEVLILGLHDDLANCDLYVGNIHCIWAELRYPALQALQAAGAVQEMYDLVAQSDTPLVICGDFNAPNDHPTYRMFTEGHFDVTTLGPDDPASPVETKCKSDYLLSEGLFRLLPPSTFAIPRPLKSAYKTVLGKEPDITNCDAACQPYKCRLCLDYLWYDERWLEATGALVTPLSEDIEKYYALPSPLFPSDHIPLVAEFAYTAGQPSVLL